MYRRVAVWLLSGLLSVAGAATAGEPGTPLEFSFVELPPFGYIDDTGVARGDLVDTAQKVFDAMGQPVQFSQLPASRLYSQMQAGTTHLTMGAGQLERLKGYSVRSSEPVATIIPTIYALETTPPAHTLEDLKGQHVTLLQGYSYGDMYRFFEDRANNIRIDYARTHESALRMLVQGRSDYLVNYRAPAELTIARLGLTGITATPLEEVGIYLFVSSALPNAEELVAQWDHHIKRLRESD